jgi:hydrogenase maturation protein HypF
MPGGDRATRHPARLAAGLLSAADPGSVESTLRRHEIVFPGGSEERDLVVQQLETGVNTPRTSSAGRFLDAVSALCGVCTERTYEGEPAMKLEAIAAQATPRPLDAPRTSVDGRPVVDTPRLFADLIAALEDGASPPAVAATAQDALARGLADIAVEAADDRGRETVALTGGVAYNDHIARRVRTRVTEAGLEFLGNERLPPGDGGIAYGQLAVAAARTA